RVLAPAAPATGAASAAPSPLPAAAPAPITTAARYEGPRIHAGDRDHVRRGRSTRHTTSLPRKGSSGNAFAHKPSSRATVTRECAEARGKEAFTDEDFTRIREPRTLPLDYHFRTQARLKKRTLDVQMRRMRTARRMHTARGERPDSRTWSAAPASERRRPACAGERLRRGAQARRGKAQEGS